MTRGSNRRDLPTFGAGWIDYSSPIETWEYWEERFKRRFSPELRTEIARALFDFRSHRVDYDAGKKDRLDSKQIKRGLKASEKTGVCTDRELRRFIEMQSLHLPNSTLAEKATYVLKEYSEYPADYTMERPNPNTLYTRALYEIFHRQNMSVSLGSVAELNSIKDHSKDNDAPETAFVEFVRRCIWDEGPSVNLCYSIQGLIKRCPICSKLRLAEICPP